MTNLEVRMCEVAIATLPKIADALNRIADALNTSATDPKTETKGTTEYRVMSWSEKCQQWFTDDEYNEDNAWVIPSVYEEGIKQNRVMRVDRLTAHEMTKSEILKLKD